MNRTPVESSNLASVGHEPSTQILQIEFKNGSVYNYYRVPAVLHKALMEADSVGKYLNQFIKNSYAYEQVDQNDAAHELASNQQQLDMDGVIVGVSRQALDEVLRDLHFLRFFYAHAQAIDGVTYRDVDAYETKHGWKAPAKYV